MSRKCKLWVIILCTVIFLSAFYVIARKVYLEKRYAPIKESLGGVSDMRNEYFSMGYIMPKSILSLRGNLYITKIRRVAEKDTGKMFSSSGCDLIVFVDFPKGYTVIAQVYDEFGRSYDDIELSENMELLSSDGTKIYNDYYDEILATFTQAHNTFHIFTLPE